VTPSGTTEICDAYAEFCGSVLVRGIVILSAGMTLQDLAQGSIYDGDGAVASVPKPLVVSYELFNR
jgi:hypothetical protein